MTPWSTIRWLFRPAILLSVVPLGPVPMAAQPPAPPPQALEQEITRMSEDWMRAVWDKDEATLNRLMTDDFVLVSPGGSNKLVRGPEWLRDVRMAGSGECTYVNVRVQGFGNDTAVVAAELSCKGDYHGIGLASNSVVSDVWVRRNGGWRVAARIVSTSPRFIGIWAPLLIGAAIPLVAWAWAASRARTRERNSLIRSANNF